MMKKMFQTLLILFSYSLVMTNLECRARIVKQNPFKFTERRPTKYDGFALPGPNRYAPPALIGGKGFSKIKQAPKYSFGMKTPLPSEKPPKYNAQIYNIRGLFNKGREHIPLGTILERHEPPGPKTIIPGPGAYDANIMVAKKQPPAYSLFPRAKPPYEPWDMWTPSPNMYLPPIMTGKKAPAYSFTGPTAVRYDNKLPGPGEFSPNVNIIKRRTPAFSFGIKTEIKADNLKPAPNAYCEKKFDYPRRRAIAPSFGIKHSIYLGKPREYLQPSELITRGK